MAHYVGIIQVLFREKLVCASVDTVVIENVTIRCTSFFEVANNTNLLHVTLVTCNQLVHFVCIFAVCNNSACFAEVYHSLVLFGVLQHA